jgi:DNA replication protein DnaC
VKKFQWNPEPRQASALIHRLMHRGEGIVIQEDSYRMKDNDPESTDE